MVTSAPTGESFVAVDMQSVVLPDCSIQVRFKSSDGTVVAADIPKQIAGGAGFQLVTNAARAHTSPENPAPDVSFETTCTLAISMLGIGAGGHLIVRFFTPLGIFLTTTLGPNLVATLASQLNSSLAQMPKPPDHWQRPGLLESPLKGKTMAKDTVTYFGQDYPQEIVEIVGVLIIRANLLEAALIRLLSAVAKLEVAQAEAIFFSSQNNRARLDLIRNLTKVSTLPTDTKSKIENAIDRAQTLSLQRNLLVHGEWSFKSDKFEVKERKALPSTKSQEPIVSIKSIKNLASNFHDLTVEMNLMSDNL